MQFSTHSRRAAHLALTAIGLMLFGLVLTACGDETATAYGYITQTAKVSNPAAATTNGTAGAAGTAAATTAPVATPTAAPTPTAIATPSLGSLNVVYTGAREVTLKSDTANAAAENFLQTGSIFGITKTQAFLTADSLDKIGTFYADQFKNAGWTQTATQVGDGGSFFRTYRDKSVNVVSLSAYPFGANQPDEVAAAGKTGDNVIVLSQGTLITCALAQPYAETKKKYFTITMDNGNTIKGEIYPDLAPKTIEHLTELVNKGFYNGLTFHRVEPGFVIQGGDPKGDGTGGSGADGASVSVPDEFTTKYKHQCGTLAMAHSQAANSQDSQFYILTGKDAPSLDSKYTIFGQVTDGMNTVFAVQKGDKMKSVTFSDTKQ